MSKSTRIGLSEYTARRLAELKARRAEADDTGGFLTSATTVNQVTTSVVNGSCNNDNSLHRTSVAEISLSAVDSNGTGIRVLDASSNTAKLLGSYCTVVPATETASVEQQKNGSTNSLPSDSDASNSGTGLLSNSFCASNGSRPSTASSVHSLTPDNSVADVQHAASNNNRRSGSLLPEDTGSKTHESISSHASTVVTTRQSADTNSVKRSFCETNDVASRITDSQQQHVQETSVKSVTLTTDSQRSVRSSSFRIAADTSANTTQRSATGTQWNAGSKVSPPIVTSSSMQLSSHDASPRPAVCAKPTAEAISAALSASASARAAVSI